MTNSQQLMVVALAILVLCGAVYIIYIIMKVREMNYEPVKLPEHANKTI